MDARTPKAEAEDRHRAIAEMVRDFAATEIKPRAAALDESESYPEELYRDMARLGLFGITTPEALGGLGADVVSYAIVMEELARGYASVADQCGLVELVATLLSEHGTPAQQARYLGPLLAFERRCAYCITEPEAGSDVSGVRTTAVRDGAGCRLTGEKIWIHNAPVADFAVVLARTDPGGRQARHVDLPRRRRCARLRARAQGAQDGPARLAGRRARLQRCRARARGAAWRGGQGLPHDDERARQGPGRHRRARRRHPAGRRSTSRSPMPRAGASSGRRSPSSRPCSGSSPTSPRRPTRRAS